MQVHLEIPDSLASRLADAGKDPAQVASVALLVEGYRLRLLSETEIKRILGYATRMQVHALLAEHDVPLNYDVEEFQKDLETLDRLRDREVSAAA